MNDYCDYSAPELVKMLGRRFKDYRMRANWTQKEVAEMSGLSILTIHRFENGKQSSMLAEQSLRFNNCSPLSNRTRCTAD